jgi:pyruvate dehydrogenase E2 component (dihydrolipoamide acetyltransferase)
VLVSSLGRQPWVVGQEVVPRDVLRLSFSADHRVTDGGMARAIEFFVELLASCSELPAAGHDVDAKVMRPS